MPSTLLRYEGLHPFVGAGSKARTIERLIRAMLAYVLPHPRRFRIALSLARAGRPFAALFDRVATLAPLGAALPPARAAPSAQHGRVILMRSCAESVLRPNGEAATLRVLTYLGYGVRVVENQSCCGALTHHMGKTGAARRFARTAIDAWIDALEEEPVDAILATVSGCGAVIKHYPDLFGDDPIYAAKAARVAALAHDVSEWLADKTFASASSRGVSVAYQSPCSLQHGQRITDAPVKLLQRAGYVVRTPKDAHLCCGSAGVYNILQPVIAGQLRERKLAALGGLACDVIATGNIGCAAHLAASAGAPVVHTIELLDWAYGGPNPLPAYGAQA